MRGPESVEGSLLFNTIDEVLEGALTGYGLAHVLEALALPHLQAGGWCPLYRRRLTPRST